MEKVGLIAAMASESNALLQRLKEYKRIAIGPLHGVLFQAGRRECTLVTSGMGIRRAAEAARLLIETIHPDCLVSFGIAGAVRADLQIGAVVMAGQNGTLKNGSLERLQPLAHLSEAAWKDVIHSLGNYGIHAYVGTAITTGGSQVVLPGNELDHPVLEMETAGLLQAAQAARIPLMVLRAISDGPLAPLPLDLTTVMDENSRLLPGKLLLELLKHPGILRRAGPMLRNSRIATDNAARALLSALQQGAPLLEQIEPVPDIP